MGAGYVCSIRPRLSYTVAVSLFSAMEVTLGKCCAKERKIDVRPGQ